MNLIDEELALLAMILSNHSYVKNLDLCENPNLTPDGIVSFLEEALHIKTLHVPVWQSRNRWGYDDDLEPMRAKLEQMGIESHIVPGKNPDDAD